MVRRGRIRVGLGLILGAFGGISLAASILPFIATRLFGMNSFEVLGGVHGYIAPTAVLWAAAGGLLGWLGGTKTGVLLLGGCGVLSGGALSVLGLEGSIALKLAWTLAGLLYGAIGGLMVGKAFEN